MKTLLLDFINIFTTTCFQKIDNIFPRINKQTKVVNLERELYNLRNELATLTGTDTITTATTTTIPPEGNSIPTTQLCDAGGGGEIADAKGGKGGIYEQTTIAILRTKITKKERTLSLERRRVFSGWIERRFSRLR